MAFVLSKVLWPITAPGNVLVLLLVLALVLQWTSWRKFGRWLATLASLTLFAIAVLPVAQWMSAPLERRFTLPAKLPAKVDGIIVIGGALAPDITKDRGRPALTSSAERMTEFVALSRRFPAARLVFTGGNASLFPEGRSTEAKAAELLLRELGVDTNRVVFEGRSRNTYENAAFSKDLVKPGANETWLMITSAAHMPRAVGCFRKVGWKVVPWPVDYHATARNDFDLAHHLSAVDLSTKEWLGLVAYRLNGFTDALFPAP